MNISSTYICLFLSTVLFLCSAKCPCENGGKCVTNTSVCICKPNFIGENCSHPAVLLTDTPLNVTVTPNFSYLYFVPEQLSFYNIKLEFCLFKKPQNYSNQVFYSLEGMNGEYAPETEESKKLYSLDFDNKKCFSETFRYFWYKRKTNQEIQKIIIGIRLKK